MSQIEYLCHLASARGLVEALFLRTYALIARRRVPDIIGGWDRVADYPILPDTVGHDSKGQRRHCADLGGIDTPL